MLKYKQSLSISLAIMLAFLLFTVFILGNSDFSGSLYVSILQRYLFVFLFSSLLFVNLVDTSDQIFTLTRFSSLPTYLKFMLAEKMKSYGLLFLTLTLFQTLLFGILDSKFNFITLIYRNLVFYILICFVYLLVLIGKKSRQFLRMVLLYLIWNFFYLILLMGEESWINQYNVFKLIQGINFSEILKFLFAMTVICLFSYLRIHNRSRYIKLWLD